MNLWEWDLFGFSFSSFAAAPAPALHHPEHHRQLWALLPFLCGEKRSFELAVSLLPMLGVEEARGGRIAQILIRKKHHRVLELLEELEVGLDEGRQRCLCTHSSAARRGV